MDKKQELIEFLGDLETAKINYRAWKADKPSEKRRERITYWRKDMDYCQSEIDKIIAEIPRN